MNRITRIGRLAAYDEDFALWSAEQAALLRAGKTDGLDRENLAEEIESLGRSDRREIARRLNVLLVHLLKWRFQPERQKGGWRATIRGQRVEIAKIISESRSLRRYPSSVLDDVYGTARAVAADETDLPEDVFPLTCPFTVDEILDPEFLPDAP